MIKLNLGCASNLLEGYVNIDQDSMEVIRKRYPYLEFPYDAKIFNYDVFNLPYRDGEVDEIIADGFIEHLSFIEEKKIFEEIKRVLKPGGKIEFSVPNFEKVVIAWLAAKDDWKDFYSLEEKDINKQHWFGTYSYNQDNRWGYITAMLFGSQHGEGQYHQNCYTSPKIHAMMTKLGFSDTIVTEWNWKGDRDPMLKTVATK